MDELKPCPFCDGEAELLISDFGSNVGCTKCRARARSFIHGVDDLDGSDIKAIKAWNTRKGEDNVKI